ncbi:MAG: hypothetical protein EOS65_01465 [Mesorhizobium sp.]|uniref:hypothetical protein n=1 Tax=Mesorhizobium sp. TaxID=1871066 RepID=UPI000FE46F7D|nr:hypothetical protein [Mesorhizobium sp.]RWF44687.1 MAG: hypothetical protein EOS65_01465 [Mesorhizobium sp.]
MAQERSLEDRLALVSPKLLAAEVWLPTLVFLDKVELCQAVRRELSQVGDLALRAIAVGKAQQAVNWLALGFYCDHSIAREALGASGTFRSSKYGFKAKSLLDVLTALQQTGAELHLSEEVRTYLASVKALAHLATPIHHLDQTLRQFLRRNADTALKSVIARVDAIFMTGHQADHGASTEDIGFYSKEDLAEGASYIVHCMDTEIGIETKHFNKMAESKISRGIFDKLIVKACKIRRYCEAEILVDAFNYQIHTSKGKSIVSAPTPELEKSIRLGYIQENQARSRMQFERIKTIKGGVISVFDISDAFYDRMHESVVKLIELPISRYTFHLPDVPPLRALFSNDAFTAEEIIYLRDIVNTELVTWEELERFELRPGLSLLDVAKVYRLFLFIARLATRQLEPLLSHDPAIAYRSLIPVFKEGVLRGLLGWCLRPKQIDDVLGLLSWKPGSTGVFDLQYRPIIRGEDGHLLVPMHIAGMANWYRNLVHTGKIRLTDSIEQEAASRALTHALQRRCKHVRAEYETVLNGQRIEIDAVCRFGEYLFLFECKHSLLPCNVHELRTSFKHVRTGAGQLDRVSHLLSDPKVEAEFYRRLGWSVGPAEEIVTCIVSCNGMFSGLRVDGHPVRRWAELLNMIEKGVVRTVEVSVFDDGSGLDVRTENVVERNLWKAAQLDPKFLYQYLKEDSVSAMLFDAMVEHEEAYSVGDAVLSFRSYALDANAITDSIAGLSDNSSA